MRLSGIATLTRRFVDAVEAVNPATRVLDTRKTTPGLRALEKAAVRAGGGHNHRVGLFDAVLIKDNHLAGLGIAEAVAKARAHVAGPDGRDRVRPDRTRSSEACRAGATVVLLDNMTVPEAAACVELVGGLRPDGSTLVEVSGGVIARRRAAVRGGRRRPDLGRRPHPLGAGPRHRTRPGSSTRGERR